jgi:indole-3-glycerol phosphate synthase / phosphoribosylanthranilate isomerase
MSILNEIVARTRQDILQRKQTTSYDELDQSDRSFLDALRTPGLSLISEIKKSSPSRGLIRKDFDPAQIASIYGRHASAISVLTNEPYFGGQRDFLRIAREFAPCPLLAKDFFVDEFQIYEARAHGANAILLMASVLDMDTINNFLEILRSLSMDALVEVHDKAELAAVLSHTDAPIVGVNSRDLKTLKIHEEQIFEMAPLVREKSRILVAESGIFERAQVQKLEPIADAVLIGSSIMLADDIEEKIEALGW